MSGAGAATLPASAAAGHDATTTTQTTTPWLGIIAVLLGVTTSVLVGQMLSVGLADLRGALHLTVDQGAWLGPVYNAGQMLTGPLTVYLGGMIGPRRVLLIAAPVAFVCALVAPWVNGYASLLGVLTLLGFACGSFYPLTLSFVARNLPPRLIPFGISAYVFDVVGSLHLSSLVEGITIRYLSWQWLFWVSLLLTGPMWFFVYRGMPEAPIANLDTKRLRPTWSGFLYTSLGLAILFLLLTQGDRLDWWRSGVIVGLLVCGCFLLLAGLVRHLVRPNPMVKLGSILRRNVLLLSLCLCVLRFFPALLGAVSAAVPWRHPRAVAAAIRDRTRMGRSADASVRTGSLAIACEARSPHPACRRLQRDVRKLLYRDATLFRVVARQLLFRRTVARYRRSDRGVRPSRLYRAGADQLRCGQGSRAHFDVRGVVPHRASLRRTIHDDTAKPPHHGT